MNQFCTKFDASSRTSVICSRENPTFVRNFGARIEERPHREVRRPGGAQIPDRSRSALSDRQEGQWPGYCLSFATTTKRPYRTWLFIVDVTCRFNDTQTILADVLTDAPELTFSRRDSIGWCILMVQRPVSVALEQRIESIMK